MHVHLSGACLSISVCRVILNNSMHDEISLPIIMLNASISILQRHRLTVYFDDCLCLVIFRFISTR